MDARLDPLNLVRAVDAAADAGADIIVVELCQPTGSNDAESLLKRAIRRAEESGVLVIAGAGNEVGKSLCVPALVPEVLAIGAYDDEGRMFRFSNWGYDGHGIAAPGGNVLGADPDGGTVVHKGTSCSAPIAAGVAALLVSLQRQSGLTPDPLVVRRALVESAPRPSRCGISANPVAAPSARW
jgi:subtilisin family serine protease